MCNSKSIAVIGATGFIGRHLVDSLCKDPSLEVRAMVHRRQVSFPESSSLKRINGNMCKRADLDALLVPGGIVINLVYFPNRTAAENIKIVEDLVAACINKGVKKIIHCSTAVVAGNTRDVIINEETTCRPSNEYEKIKLAIERTMIEKSAGKIELAILRPTAVFGPGGENLMKLGHDLHNGNYWKNYLKASILQERSMSLVCVGNVVSAISFLTFNEHKMRGDVFIITDDEYVENNYRYIESFLRKSWCMYNYIFPLFPVPGILSTVFLKLRGRGNFNVKYSSQKLMGAGYVKTHEFIKCLAEFADWFKDNIVKGKAERK